MKTSDEMFVCDRCGVSFLWTMEEQRASSADRGGLDCCLGCSFLLPGPGRERGLVKWYSPRKKYGFITPTSGTDLFAHRSRLDGVGRLRQGDLVEFTVEETEKGRTAVDVRLLSHKRDPSHN